MIAAEVRVEPFADGVEALGTLKTNESVSVTADVTETVSAIYFDDGPRVKRGDVLVEMTSADEHALLEEVRARVAEAASQFNRVRSLANQRSASEPPWTSGGAIWTRPGRSWSVSRRGWRTRC